VLLLAKKPVGARESNDLRDFPLVLTILHLTGGGTLVMFRTGKLTGQDLNKGRGHDSQESKALL